MSRENSYKALIPIGSAIIFAGVAGYLYYKLFDKVGILLKIYIRSCNFYFSWFLKLWIKTSIE